MSIRIPISEIFGPTIQGEGPAIGKPTVFVRSGGCSYRCSWCDTLYAVLPQYGHTWTLMGSQEIFKQIQSLSPTPILVTLSGGNPAMHDFSELIDLGQSHGYTFTIETQGDIAPSWFSKLDHVVLSPKPPSSQMRTNLKILDDCIFACKHSIDERVSLKIVVSDEKDYRYACEIFDRYSDRIKNLYITPCNISPGDPDMESIINKTKFVIDMVLRDRRFNIRIVPQLHVILYGNKRGV